MCHMAPNGRVCFVSRKQMTVWCWSLRNAQNDYSLLLALCNGLLFQLLILLLCGLHHCNVELKRSRLYQFLISQELSVVIKVMFVALALLYEYLQEVLVKIFHCSELYMAQVTFSSHTFKQIYNTNPEFFQGSTTAFL